MPCLPAHPPNARPAFRLALPALIAGLLLSLVSGPTPQTHAQTAEPQMSITLYSDDFTYRTSPQTLVNAELQDESGQKAEGIGVADASGTAQVGFFLGGAVIEPGDTVIVSRVGSSPLEVQVPEMGLSADTDTDTLSGTAPAGTNLDLVVTMADGAQIERTATADDGTFIVDLAGEADLVPGGFHAEATLTTEHAEITALAASLTATFIHGAATVTGEGTPGDMVTLARVAADGTRQPVGQTRITNGYEFQVGPPPGPGRVPFAAGQTWAVIQGSTEIEATLEAVQVLADADGKFVMGQGPADTVIHLTADSMDGDVVEEQVTTAPDGAFELDLLGVADLSPGWRVEAAYQATPEIRVASLAVLPQARIGIGVPLTYGRAQPGSPVTATLVTTTGDIKARQRSQVNPRGEYQIAFGGFGGFGGAQGPRPVAGDIVELEFITGDAELYPVPAFTAQADPETDTVVGEAPNGAEVRVGVGGPGSPGGPSGTMATATAGPANTFEATFSDYDLEPPANGSALLTLPNGHQFHTSWAAMQLNVALGGVLQPSVLFGNAPAGAFVTAELLDSEGQVVGSGSSPVFGGNVVIAGPGGATSPQYFIELTDITGTQVDVRPGDRIRLAAGWEAFEFEVPPLEVVVLLTDNTVAGQTAPNASVSIQVSQSATSFEAAVTAQADSSGAFSHDFTGELTLRPTDLLQLIADVGDHNVLAFEVAPGLVLDLDQRLLVGVADAGTEVSAEITRADEPIFSETTQADADGAFGFLVADARGRLALEPGDRIVVTPAGAAEPFVLEVPTLEIRWDADADLVFGSASPEGSLTLFATEAYSRGDTIGISQAWPAIGPSTDYQAQFVPSLDVRPGREFLGLYRPAGGHYVVRTRTVPILNVEHAGPNACGFGDPETPISVAVDRAGTDVASAETVGRFDGYFSTLLRDGSALVATQAADRVAAELGATDAAVELPNLELNVNWQTRQLSGSGPANTVYTLQPAVPCPQQQVPGLLDIQVTFALPSSTGPGGEIAGFVPPFLTGAGGGVEVAFFDAAGHRYFRHLYPTAAQVFIRTDRVAGQTNVMAPVEVAVAAGSDVKGQASGAAGPAGAFDLRVAGPGDGVTIEPGDLVTVTTSGAVAAIEVEPLAFDWSPGRAVLGSAPAGRNVQVRLRLGSGQVLTVDRTADDEGRFSFGPDEVPPRATWDMDDVVGVRVVLPLPGGHAIVDQTPSFEPQPRQGARIYLPALHNGEGGTGPQGSGERAQPVSVGQRPATARGTFEGVGYAEAWRHFGQLRRGQLRRGQFHPTAAAPMGRPAVANWHPAVELGGQPVASSLQAVEPSRSAAALRWPVVELSRQAVTPSRPVVEPSRR